jgi:small subunit ribosomal protein S6e
MEYKVVVSDPKTGKSYQVSVKDDHAKKISGKAIGDAFEGSLIDLPGYKLKITGGSDKGGFPMKEGLHLNRAMRVLMGNGVGFKAKKGQRARVRVHGEVIGEQIVQVNATVLEYGSKTLESILGKKEAESPTGEKKE